MKAASRTLLSLAILAVTLTAAVIWSLSFWIGASQDADQAAADTALTRGVILHIRELRSATGEGALSTTAGNQLPRLLDDAMKSAKVDAENLTRISPQPYRRIGQGNSREMPVLLVFHQIMLKELLTFLTTLLQPDNGLFLRNLHLNLPDDSSGDGATVEWNAEVTVSYVVEAPTEPVNATANIAN